MRGSEVKQEKCKIPFTMGKRDFIENNEDFY